MDRLADHFHDTYGQAIENAWVAYECGIRVFDSAVGGLGGCPYAPGAKGNVATEDIVYLFQQAGIDTGVDLTALSETGHWISDQLSKIIDSRAGTALVSRAVRSKQRTSGSAGKQNQAQIPIGQLDWKVLRETAELIISQSNRSLKVTLNNPRNGNALTASMLADLTKLFKEAAQNSSISRIVIDARGKYFCTGMDLSKETTPVGRAGNSATNAQFKRLSELFKAIDEAPHTTISCIQGPAFGGGIGLAFCCDIRIGCRKATMTLSEAKLGLSPATISPYIYREWGLAFAREAMLTGRPVSMEELASHGAITLPLLESADELPARLNAYLSRLRYVAPGASTHCKELARLAWKNAGGPDQAKGIHAVFDEMMSDQSEGAYGVKQLQNGVKNVDWDAYATRKSGPKI